jgi:hypothetical protein
MAAALVCTAAGTVMVLTTPDANRTFLSYLGSQHEVALTPALEHAIACARMLVIEGYLWETPNAEQCILAAIEVRVLGARVTEIGCSWSLFGTHNRTYRSRPKAAWRSARASTGAPVVLWSGVWSV